MRQSVDPDSVSAPIGAVAQGLRDVIDGRDTAHADAFLEVAAHALVVLCRRAIKGGG